MQFPGGTRMLMTLVEVAAGAALGTVAAKKLNSGPSSIGAGGKIAGLPTEAVIGGALLGAALFMGADYGKDLAALAAGALSIVVVQKTNEALAPGTGISGWPYYQVGNLPSGAAMYALPPGAQGIGAQNLAAGIAGLA